MIIKVEMITLHAGPRKVSGALSSGQSCQGLFSVHTQIQDFPREAPTTPREGVG